MARFLPFFANDTLIKSSEMDPSTISTRIDPAGEYSLCESRVRLICFSLGTTEYCGTNFSSRKYAWNFTSNPNTYDLPIPNTYLYTNIYIVCIYVVSMYGRHRWGRMRNWARSVPPSAPKLAVCFNRLRINKKHLRICFFLIFWWNRWRKRIINWLWNKLYLYVGCGKYLDLGRWDRIRFDNLSFLNV